MKRTPQSTQDRSKGLTIERFQEPTAGRKINITAKDAEGLRRGLAQLVLQIIDLLRRLMEKQVLRKIGSLPPEKQEELGLHLMLLDQKIEEMRLYFGLRKSDLELGLLKDVEDLLNHPLQSIAREIGHDH